MSTLFDKKFYEVFTDDELKYLENISVASGKNCLCITDNDFFIEISSDISDELEITYSKDNISKILTKEELFGIVRILEK